MGCNWSYWSADHNSNFFVNGYNLPMSYDFVFAGGRLKCFKIDLDTEAIVYSRTTFPVGDGEGANIDVQEAVFNVSDEKFTELKGKGMMDADKIIIVLDIVDDNMTIELLPG